MSSLQKKPLLPSEQNFGGRELLLNHSKKHHIYLANQIEKKNKNTLLDEKNIKANKSVAKKKEKKLSNKQVLKNKEEFAFQLKTFKALQKIKPHIDNKKTFNI